MGEASAGLLPWGVTGGQNSGSVREDGIEVLKVGALLGAMQCWPLATGHPGELSLGQGHDQNGPPFSSPCPFFSPPFI